MWVCSGKNSDSKPRCSAIRASSAGSCTSSVGKIATPNFTAVTVPQIRAPAATRYGVSMTEHQTDQEGGIQLSDEQWRERLTPEQYEVLRWHGPERLHHLRRPGPSPSAALALTGARRPRSRQ